MNKIKVESYSMRRKNNMYGLPSSYDEWKTACCGNYPDCSHCPYENGEDNDEDKSGKLFDE